MVIIYCALCLRVKFANLMFEVYYSTNVYTAMCYRLKIFGEKFLKATNQNINSLQAILAIQYIYCLKKY